MMDKNEFLDLILQIGLLKKVQRTGWVLKGIKDVESVAEHSWRVAMLALLFADDFKQDKLKLVKMSLIHDLGEVVIGDVKLTIPVSKNMSSFGMNLITKKPKKPKLLKNLISWKWQFRLLNIKKKATPLLCLKNFGKMRENI